MALLTNARRSLWIAVDNSSELVDATSSTGRSFNSTYRFDGSYAADVADTMIGSVLESLGAGDLPALQIQPVSVTPVWYTNEMQVWPFMLNVILFTQDWGLEQPEDLVEKLCNAIYRYCRPADGTVPVVKAVTGYYPHRLGPIMFQQQLAGQQRDLKVLQTTLTIALRLQKDPFTGA